jgi:ABC-2 type transport system permease protein
MSVIAATLPAAFRDAWANRRSFWFQITVMVVNDLTWVIFWWFFFHRVPNIRGWTLQDVLVLFAIVLTISGISIGVLSNCRRIGHIAADGELDAVLTLPVPPLAYLLTRRIDTAMLGDLLLGPVLFVVAGNPTPERAAVYVFGCIAGAIALVGFLVAISSLTLFAGGRGEQADLGFHAVLVLSSYPIDFFGGATKVLLFTAVPAAFVTGLPSTLMRTFNPAVAAATLAASLVLAALAGLLFHRGLRRYASGSLWTRS